VNAESGESVLSLEPQPGGEFPSAWREISRHKRCGHTGFLMHGEIARLVWRSVNPWADSTCAALPLAPLRQDSCRLFLAFGPAGQGYDNDVTRPFSLAYKQKMLGRLTSKDAVTARQLSLETGVSANKRSRDGYRTRVSVSVMPSKRQPKEWSNRLAERFRVLVDEDPHHRGDVLDPLAQRRNDVREHVEAIEQILAKGLVADGVLEVAVGGRDDADVNLDRLRAPQAFEDALLKRAEQLGLDFHRQITDLVEEERGLVGGFEPADLPAERAGERAPLAPEQLAFDERGRNGRAAHP